MTLDPFGITELYPTAGGGLEWFSNWQSGSLRYVVSDTYDATDTDFGAILTGHGNKLSVSCGVAHIRQLGEYRLFVDGPWTNTEMTIFANLHDTTTSSIQLRSRANHFGVGLQPFASDALYVNPNPQGVADYMSCGFGNYIVFWGQTHPIDFAGVGIEIIHELYKTGLTSDAVTINNDQWIGYKQVTRTLANGHVKVEAYNNFNGDKTTWDLVTEFEFDGSNAAVSGPTITFWQTFLDYCADKGDMISGDINAHQIFTGPGKWSFIRINNASKVDLKYYSVREITPF